MVINMDTKKEQELIEKLSALEHEQWSCWAKYMLGCMNSNNVKRWNEQSTTSYFKLSEKDKEKDRIWAKKVIKLLKDEKVI